MAVPGTAESPWVQSVELIQEVASGAACIRGEMLGLMRFCRTGQMVWIQHHIL